MKNLNKTDKFQLKAYLNAADIVEHPIVKINDEDYYHYGHKYLDVYIQSEIPHHRLPMVKYIAHKLHAIGTIIISIDDVEKGGMDIYFNQSTHRVSYLGEEELRLAEETCSSEQELYEYIFKGVKKSIDHFWDAGMVDNLFTISLDKEISNVLKFHTKKDYPNAIGISLIENPALVDSGDDPFTMVVHWDGHIAIMGVQQYLQFKKNKAQKQKEIRQQKAERRNLKLNAD